MNVISLISSGGPNVLTRIGFKWKKEAGARPHRNGCMKRGLGVKALA